MEFSMWNLAELLVALCDISAMITIDIHNHMCMNLYKKVDCSDRRSDTSENQGK